MPQALKVAIVNGYGIVLDESYVEHLDIVAKCGEDFEYIIVSGGTTSEINRTLSEADVMCEYLKSRNDLLVYKVAIEGGALTTRQNLILSRAKLNRIIPNAWVNRAGIDLLDITVFCKKPWVPKVKLLSYFILKSEKNYWTSSESTKVKVRVQGTAPANGWKEQIKQTIAGTLVEFFCHIIPKLEEIKIRRKFPWKFAEKGGPDV